MDEMVQQQQQMQATPVQPSSVQMPPPQRPLSPPTPAYYQATPTTTAPLWQQRSDGITLVAGFHFVVAALFLLGTVVMMIPTAILGVVSVVDSPDAVFPMFIVGFIAVITLLLSLLYLAIGYGLWTLKQWARVSAMALAMVSLFGVPIGTITGGLTLWYLMQPAVATRFETQ